MTTYGLSSTGYVARTAADLLTVIRDYVDAETGQTIEYDRDTFWGIVTAVQSIQLGRLEQGLQAVYDVLDRNNATNVHLDVLGFLVGVQRNDSTYSTATVTATGTPSTVVEAGFIVEGGGDDDKARWQTALDYTVGVGGTVDVAVTCTERGEVTAAIGFIDKIVTPVDGVTSVSNAAAAAEGNDREEDAAYRARQVASLQIRGAAAANSIKAALLDLDYLDAAIVMENDDGDSASILGVTIVGHAVAVVVWPDTITAAQQSEVADTINGKLSAGIYSQGTDVAYNVTLANGEPKTIRYDWADDVTVNVATTVELDTGYVLGDVDTAIQALISAYFDAIEVGEDIQDLDLQTLCAGVDGVKRATCTLNGGTGVTPDGNEILVLGTNTVTT